MSSNAFPALQPALSVMVTLDPPLSVGGASRGTGVVVVPMVGGTMKSEPGFSPEIDATFEGTGNDYIRTDPDNKHWRLDAHSVIKNKNGGRAYVHYTGIITLNEPTRVLLMGEEGAKTTDFGNIFTEMRFETGDDSLKELEHNTFVGSGRFVLEEGKPLAVEYKMSRVVRGQILRTGR